MKKDKSFSIVEMLIVLLIISILSMRAVTRPVGNVYFDVMRIKNDISYVYNKAFSSNMNIKIYYYQNSNKISFRAGSKTIIEYTLRYGKITNYSHFKNMVFTHVGTVSPTSMICVKDLQRNHYFYLSVGLFGYVNVSETAN